MTNASLEAGVEQVMAFRLGAHHLDRRLRAGHILEAAGACALQDSPPGSAAIALHARVAGVGPTTITDAIEDRRLLHTWCMRGSPFFFPTSDLDVFTTGVLPTDEPARRRFILGVEQALDRLGMSMDEATDQVRSATRGVLRGRRLAINELGARLAQTIGAELPAATRRTWQQEGPHAAGQPLGEAVTHFCLRLLTLEQIVCFAHREGNKLPFVLVEEWLATTPPNMGGEAARAEIARRYLHRYGPSTRTELAAWLGIAAQDADPWWSVINDELCEVRVDGRSRWLLATDLDALSAPPRARGVRVLPPRDPLLQLRDRESLVPNKKLHPHIWKTIGEPGTILVNGRLVATWRPRKKGKKLTVTVEPFASLTKANRDEMETEIASIAALRGCSSSEVSFNP